MAATVPHLRNALEQYREALCIVYAGPHAAGGGAGRPASGAVATARRALVALQRWITISCGLRGQALAVGALLDIVDADDDGRMFPGQDVLDERAKVAGKGSKPAQGDEEATVDEQQDDRTADFFLLQTLRRVLEAPSDDDSDPTATDSDLAAADDLLAQLDSDSD